MADREKVIKGLEAMRDFLGVGLSSQTQVFEEDQKILEDAIAMLKEQEPVKPTWGRGKPFCGACGLRIHGGKFCSECGRPIAWEGR